MTNLNSVLKIRDITLPTKACIVKVIIFPIVMYRCLSWAINKAVHQRIDAFKLWSWRRLLEVPWKAKRSNQSILKEIDSEYSLERLKAGGDGMTEDETIEWHHHLNGHEFEQTPGDSEGQRGLVYYSP